MLTELPHQPVGDCQVRSCRQVLAVPARDRLLPIEGHGRLAYSGSELAVRDIISADVPLVPPLVLPQGGVASAPTGVQEGGDSRRHGPLHQLPGAFAVQLPESGKGSAPGTAEASSLGLRELPCQLGPKDDGLNPKPDSGVRHGFPGWKSGFRAGSTIA